MSQKSSAFSPLLIEAGLAMAYETWVGPTYLSTWAGTLGVERNQLAWLTALPILGSLGQAVGVLLFLRLAKNISLKHLCLTLTLFARSLWLIPLVAAWSGSKITAESVGMIGVLAAASSAIGLTSTSFWMAWMRTLVPAHQEGWFWGGRNHWSTIGVLCAHFFSAVWLKANAGATAFEVLLLLALLSALGSLWLLSRLPAATKSNTPEVFRFEFKRLQEPQFKELLLFAGLFHGAMTLAGPYFPYYFTRELGLNGSHVAFWSIMAQLGMWLTSSFWGRQLDLNGGLAFRVLGKPLSVLKLGTILMSLSPLPYIISNPPVIQWVGPAEYFINGVASAAYAIALNTLIFQRTRGNAFMSMTLFSAITAIQGILGASTALLGSKILDSFSSTGFQALWVIAAASRLGVVVFFCPKLALPSSASSDGSQPLSNSASDLAHELK
ncbi:MAG: hypothetical protein KGQ59_03305 [Bdellovibrionales bacterium]|nr:hypothetical protein [Bdellovibrionales bacterium]